MARAILGMSHERCVVTFDSYADNRSLGRPGFEQNTFRSAGIDAIHIIASDNHGYQYADFPDLCASVAEVTASYKHVVAYGSSMGGYAAIRYGGWAGARLALALSPQFSLDPLKPPFDRRWRKWVRKIRFLHEHGQDVVEQAIVVYDPMNELDDAHARLLHRITNVIPVPLPGSGHPSTGVLSDLGLLHRIGLEVCHETFDAKCFIEEACRRSEESPQFHFTRAQRAPNFQEQYRLMAEALARAPTHDATLHEFAHAAIMVGLPEVALEALDRARRAEGRTPYLRALAHAKAGRLELAIELMEELCQRSTDAPHYRIILAKFKRQRGFQVWVHRPWQWIKGQYQAR